MLHPTYLETLFEECNLDTSYCSKKIINVSHSESLDDPPKKAIGNDVDEDSKSASVDDDEAKKKKASA